MNSCVKCSPITPNKVLWSVIIFLLTQLCTSNVKAQEFRYVSYRNFQTDGAVQSEIAFDTKFGAGTVNGNFFSITQNDCAGNINLQGCFVAPREAFSVPKAPISVGDKWRFAGNEFTAERVVSVSSKDVMKNVFVISQCKDSNTTSCIRYLYSRVDGIRAIQYANGVTYVLEGSVGLSAETQK